MDRKFAEVGFISCLLRRQGESAEQALSRFYEIESVDADQIVDPTLRAMYLYVREQALDDIAVTPEILAAEFDVKPESLQESVRKHPVDALPLYVAEINRQYVRKIAIETAGRLQAAAESGDPQQLLEAVRALDTLGLADEKRIYTLAEQAAVFLNLFEEDQRRFRDGSIKVQFPLPKLNEKLPRVMDDDVILLTARSKVGKSSFSTQMAYLNAHNKLNVAYFHFEDPPARVGYRRAAQMQLYVPQDVREQHTGTRFGMPYYKMMSALLTDQEQAYVRYLTTLAIQQAGTYLTYIYASGWTCEKMVAVWRQLHKQRPFDLVIIDYLNKMTLNGAKLRDFGSFGARGQDVELIKQEAGRPNARVPVVLIQQENEDGTPRDSKDSYIKAQAWISLQRLPVESDPDRFENDGEVVVKRANDGMTGGIPAQFYPPFMVWSERP